MNLRNYFPTWVYTNNTVFFLFMSMFVFRNYPCHRCLLVLAFFFLSCYLYIEHLKICALRQRSLKQILTTKFIFFFSFSFSGLNLIQKYKTIFLCWFAILYKLAITVQQKKRKIAKLFVKIFVFFIFTFFKNFVCKARIEPVDKESVLKKVCILLPFYDIHK